MAHAVQKHTRHWRASSASWQQGCCNVAARLIQFRCQNRRTRRNFFSACGLSVLQNRKYFWAWKNAEAGRVMTKVCSQCHMANIAASRRPPRNFTSARRLCRGCQLESGSWDLAPVPCDGLGRDLPAQALEHSRVS